MASFGITDALSALVIVYDLAIKLKAEAAELKGIAKRVKKAKNQLTEIQLRVEDPKHPLGRGGARAKSMFEADIKNIKNGCKQAVLYIKQRQRIISIDLPSKVYYNSFTLPKLRDIVEGFEKSTASINQSVGLLLGDASKRLEEAAKRAEEATKRLNASIKGNNKEQSAKLDKMMKQQKELADQQNKAWEALLDKLDAEHKKDRLAWQKEAEKNARVVHILEQKFGTKGLENAALGVDGKKCAEKMVDELVNNGIDKKDATKRVNATLTTVREEKQSHKAPLKRARTIEAQKGADPPASKNDAPPKAVKSSKVTTQGVTIMCIDTNNGARSVIAQTYLELLRVFTMNTQKRWLFKCADSMGIRISTPFTKDVLENSEYKALKDDKRFVSKLAIAAIAGDSAYFQTDDFPKEKETVLKRMYEHRTKGLLEAHLLKYDYILCFGHSTRKLLDGLIKALQSKESGKKVKAKIIDIKEGNWYTGIETKETLMKLSSQLKVALKTFAKTELSWERPSIGISEGEWRTLQVLVSRAEKDNLSKEKGGLTPQKIWEKKGCKMIIVPDTDNNWLVSISGPQKQLAGAQKLMEAGKT